MDFDTVTIEDCAQSANCTWRTARKRIDEAQLRPVKSTKKSELYDRIPALRAVVFHEPRDLEMVDRLLGFLGSVLIPKLFSTGSPFLRYFLGLLRERGGLSKAEALNESGALLMMFSETITRDVLPGELLIEKSDLWQDLADLSEETGLNGLPLFEKYVEKRWPDEPA